jgi:ABC-type thiamine transport system ATPase subunit
VFLDGVDVRELDLAWLRGRLSIVPQDAFLFSATMAENIAYGVEREELEEVRRVARLASLDDDVRAFPRGYETRIGERGITLSGGQKQRTAIARALLRDAPVLLLDDCLSSVDTQTEEAILHGLRVEMRRRTTLIVSHRVSTVRDADLILVFDEGRIVESGRHDELLGLGGRYAALHRAQQLEEEIRRHDPRGDPGRRYDHRLMRWLMGFLQPSAAGAAVLVGPGGSQARGSRRRRSTTGSATATSFTSTRSRCSTCACWRSGSGSPTCSTRSSSGSARA